MGGLRLGPGVDDRGDKCPIFVDDWPCDERQSYFRSVARTTLLDSRTAAASVVAVISGQAPCRQLYSAAILHRPRAAELIYLDDWRASERRQSIVAALLPYLVAEPTSEVSTDGPTRFGGEIACNALAVMFRASVAELRSSAPRTSNELRSHRNFFFWGGAYVSRK